MAEMSEQSRLFTVDEIHLELAMARNLAAALVAVQSFDDDDDDDQDQHNRHDEDQRDARCPGKERMRFVRK